MTEKEVEEFLRESNKIEREYGEVAYQDALQAWNMACLCSKSFNKDEGISYLLGIHRRLMKRLNHHIAGKIRRGTVYIGGERRNQSKEEIETELQNLFKRYDENKSLLLDMPESTREEFVKEWHIRYEFIHPFPDGNGRTGRILMNIQRLMLGLPILVIHEGKEQYEYYKWFRRTK